MDSPKHQSDPSEDEDERSTQKVVRGIVFFNRKKKYHSPKMELLATLGPHILKIISSIIDFLLCRKHKNKCVYF